MAAGTTFELLKFLQADAADIAAARKRSQLIHGTADIKMAGDEVEGAVRSFLRNRLSLQHYVGHGHVVDAAWRVSRQHDVIIADGTGTPVLFRGQNGAEYLPFDSVYAVGEVRSTYYSSAKPISTFVANLAELRSQLSRAKAPSEYVGNGLSLPGFKLDDPRPYKNPLFTFMIFVDAGDFSLDDVRDLYRSTPTQDLPNVVCFMNRGNILYLSQLGPPPAGGIHFHPVPEFHSTSGLNAPHSWCFLESNGEMVEGATLSTFYGLLSTHLVTCKLLPILPIDYFKAAIGNFNLTPVA